MTSELVVLKNITKCFPLSVTSSLWNKPTHNSSIVLDNISLSIRTGETVGIMGINGSGKSTLLQIIAGTMQPTSGTIQRSDGICSLLDLGSGLHPDFDAIENIKLYRALLCISRKDITSYIDGVLRFSEIPQEAIKNPVKTYSTGMKLRLAFACLTEKIPKLLVVDEALAVGDVAFQTKCYQRIHSYKNEGMSLVLVSHDPQAITMNTTYSYLLSKGAVIYEGESRDVTNKYIETSSKTKINKLNQNSFKISLHHDNFSETDGYLLNENRWGDNRARIIGFKLSDDPKGRHKILYRPGEKLNIQFTFTCYEEIFNLVPGVLLKSKEGIILFGTNSINVDNKLIHACENESYTASFEFDVNLSTGDYLISVGLSSIENSEFIAVDKRYDSILINVESAKKDTGILSLNTNYSHNQF